ncbi:MAG: hypothetical protein HQK52_22975 [Oligoflexia bacterium]|nr:hypothetical protein [Oligoflexia bacterium]
MSNSGAKNKILKIALNLCKIQYMKIIAHSPEYKSILSLADHAKRRRSIRKVIHSHPLLVFWVSPAGEVLDAGNAHRSNPPDKDKSIFIHPTNRGFLRGRAAFFGESIYIVIYLNRGNEILSEDQLILLEKSYYKIYLALSNKHPSLICKIHNAFFITELGDVLKF